MSEKPMTGRPLREKVAGRNGSAGRGGGWTVPGPIEQEEQKGTAAAHPVVVGGPDGRDEAAAAKDERSPAEIEADIDRTREHLSATLDELTERLTPRNVARAGGRRAKAQFVDPQTGRVNTMRVAALAGGAGAVVGALLMLRRIRRRR
jgi:LPXTG-motif cell wall-anchored protein